VWGAVLGAGIVVVLKEFLQSSLPVVFHGTAQLETVIFGILLVALLQIAPGGMWPRLAALFPITPARRRLETTAALPVTHRPQEGSQSLLNVVKARKKFGGVVAVNDVSFDVKTGDIVGLHRSERRRQKHHLQSRLRCVAGMTGGNISSVLGQRVERPREPQDIVPRGVSRTFQHVKLVPDMTVLENVAIGTLSARTRKRDRKHVAA
jgi:hypothetical protein